MPAKNRVATPELVRELVTSWRQEAAECGRAAAVSVLHGDELQARADALEECAHELAELFELDAEPETKAEADARQLALFQSTPGLVSLAQSLEDDDAMRARLAAEDRELEQARELVRRESGR